MAIDGRLKRQAAAGLSLPWHASLPDPDGALSYNDRLLLAHAYPLSALSFWTLVPKYAAFWAATPQLFGFWVLVPRPSAYWTAADPLHEAWTPVSAPTAVSWTVMASTG